MLFKKKQSSKKMDRKKMKQEKKVQQAIQDLIPIKDIDKGKLITTDNKMVTLLKVGALNLELTSNSETNELFEIFESFAMTLMFPIQITNVSVPIDLKTYVNEQKKKMEKTTNPHKRKLQASYIEYSENIEVNEEIMQRQRFVILSEKLKEDTPDHRFKTSLELEERKAEIASSLRDLELEVSEVNDLEIIRYFHTLFDYEGAQTRPIESTYVPEIIQGGKLDVQ